MNAFVRVVLCVVAWVTFAWVLLWGIYNIIAGGIRLPLADPIAAATWSIGWVCVLIILGLIGAQAAEA